MITIYHNSRCSKSRQGLELLKDANVDFEVVTYLENIPTEKELNEIISKLGINPIDLVRTNEAIWKERYKGKTLSDGDIVTAMVKYPKLIERPIVINGNKAVIGRPSEKILNII